MNIESIDIVLPLIILTLVTAYLADRKKKKKDNMREQTTNSTAPYLHETMEDFYTRCRNHIEAYLNKNQHRFYTSGSATQFLVPFESDDGFYQILITPYYLEGVKLININARITTVTVPDNMLSPIAELINRMNTHLVNIQLSLDYETRHVMICKALPVFHYEINDIMFDWYFGCVRYAVKTRAYLDRVLLNNESPALVALDYIHA